MNASDMILELHMILELQDMYPYLVDAELISKPTLNQLDQFAAWAAAI